MLNKAKFGGALYRCDAVSCVFLANTADYGFDPFNKFDEAGKEMIISFNTNMMSVKVKYYGCTSPNITRKEIEAIYMKMKELGWLW